MKKYFRILIICFIFLYTYFYSRLFAENTNTSKSSTAKAAETYGQAVPAGGDADFNNESLFTGCADFSVPIISIGGVNVALKYNSNVHKLVRASNQTAQAGWVGLGWSLKLGSIVADINGTQDVSDDHYYYVSSSGTEELVHISGDDFMLKEYRYWKITRNVNAVTHNLIGWTIIMDNGITMRFGNYHSGAFDFNYETFNVPNATGATRFCLGWGGIVANPPSSAFGSATYIAYQWDLSDVEDIAHNHTTISYQQIVNCLTVNTVSSSLYYTQESYPLKIVDRAGRSVEFVLGDLTSGVEYIAPPDKIIQRQIETKYLNKVIKKDKNGIIILQHILDYSSVLDIFDKGSKKRYLTSISVQDANTKSLPSTKFDYYITAGSFGANPGALKSITYPTGGSIQYTYQAQPLANVTLNANPSFSSNPPVLTTDIYSSFMSGSDFYVIKIGDNTIKVYRWGATGWYQDNTFPVTGAVEKYWVCNNYVVVRLNRTTLQVTIRKGDGWTTPYQIQRDVTDMTYEVLAVSPDYFLAGGYAVFVTSGMPDPGKILEAGFLLDVTKIDNNQCRNQIIESIYASGWQPDLQKQYWSNNNKFFVTKNIQTGKLRVYRYSGTSWQKDPEFSGGDPYPIACGRDYVVTTNSNKTSIEVWKWNGINWISSFSQTCSSIMRSYACDNFIVHQHSDNNIYIETWNGNGWTQTSLGNYPNANITVGNDYVAIGSIDPNSTPAYNGTLTIWQLSHTASGVWSKITLDQRAGMSPYTVANQKCSITPVENGNALFVEWFDPYNYHNVKAYTKGFDIWASNGSLDDNVSIGTSYAQPPNGYYWGPRGQSFTQPGENFIADVINPYRSGISDQSHSFMQGTDQAGNPIFAGNPYDYPVASKTVSDAMGNSYTTNFNFNNGVLDDQLNYAKYNKVTVTPPGNNGKTVTYSYNDLPKVKCEQFVSVDNYQQLDGFTYLTIAYNNAGSIVSQTTNTWSAYAIDAQNQVYHSRLLQKDEMVDGITNTVRYAYNNTNGRVNRTTEDVDAQSNLSGKRDAMIQLTYAFENNSMMQTKNMLVQIAEQKEYAITNDIIINSLSGYDGTNHTQDMSFTVSAVQTVIFHYAGNGIGEIRIGTSQGGSDIFRTLLPATGGDGIFEASPGTTYWLRSYCAVYSAASCSCYYFQNADLLADSKTNYSTSAPYFPVSTQVFDGTNLITTNTIISRDSYGNVLESQNVDGVHSTTKYANNGTLPIAQITNASNSETSIVDFEDGTAGEWTVGFAGVASSVAHTGNYGWYLQGNQYRQVGIQFNSGLNKSGKYTFSAWVKSPNGTPYGRLVCEVLYNYASSDVKIPLANTTSGTTNWQFLSGTIDLSNYSNIAYVIVTAENGTSQQVDDYYWDDLRFSPSNAFINTSTYDPKTLQVTSVTDANGISTYYQYDSFGRLIQTNNDDGAVLSQTTYYYSRNQHNGTFSTSDPNYTQTFTYPNGIYSTPLVTTTFTDGLGRVLQTHVRNEASDNVAVVGYDNTGKQAIMYKAYSLSTPNQYDAAYTTNSPGYSQFQYYADPLSRVHWSIPIGSSSQNQHTEYVPGSAALDGTQNGILYNDTDIKQKPATTSANWVTSRQYFDRLGRIIKSSILDGTTEIQSSTTLYNIKGQPVQTIDPKGLQSTAVYDFLGHVISQTTPDGGTSKCIYDKAGRLRFMVDANGLAATPYNNILYWKYDLFGRVIEKGYINTMNWGDGSTLQTYANTAEWPTTPNTWRKKFVYDAGGSVQYMNGRLYKAEVNNNNDGITDVQETFVYDKYGNVLTHNLNAYDYSGSTYSTSYIYDNIGRVKQVTYPSRPASLTVQSQTISNTIPYQYEANTTLIAGPSFTINSGANVTLKAGTTVKLVSGFKASLGSTFRAYTGTFSDGGTPTIVTYTYNACGQVASVGNASNFAYYASYTYNPDGSILTEQFNASGLNARTYAYDIQGKLTSISNSKFNETLTYESGGVGGVGYYHGNIASTAISYWSGAQPTSYSSLYQYDNLGRLTAASLANYTDPNLSQFSASSASYYSNGTFNQRTNAGVIKNYMYYPSTNRIKNTSGSSTTTDYNYDASGNVVKSTPKNIPTVTYDPFTNMTMSITASTRTESYEYTSDNERVLKNDLYGTTKNTTLYLRGGNSCVLTEKTNQQGTIADRMYIYGPTGLIAIISGSNTYFIMKDHLGSTRALVDKASGIAGSTYDYQPFGGMMRSYVVGADIKYRFTEQEYETETGLHNFHARMYDDDLARFYSTDCAGQFFDIYNYVGNNPVSFIDPTGMYGGYPGGGGVYGGGGNYWTDPVDIWGTSNGTSLGNFSWMNSIYSSFSSSGSYYSNSFEYVPIDFSTSTVMNATYDMEGTVNGYAVTQDNFNLQPLPTRDIGDIINTSVAGYGQGLIDVGEGLVMAVPNLVMSAPDIIGTLGSGPYSPQAFELGRNIFNGATNFYNNITSRDNYTRSRAIGQLAGNIATFVASGFLKGGQVASKGQKFFNQFARSQPFDQSIEELGSFIKYSVKIPGSENGFTTWVKVFNKEGQTLQLYHDTFDMTGKFMHRSWKLPSPTRHVWWNGRITR